MTAALGNTAQGTPFATGVDAFVYPQFIGYALRAPTTNDIYNPGTRWQDNSVSPAVIYNTTGAGNWIALQTSSGNFASLAVSGLSTLSGGVNTAPSVVAAGASPRTSNNRSGQVTFSGVSIAAGATQSFVINNTSIAAIGTVILYAMVGATTGAALNIQSVTNVAGTSSTIVVENGTGATTSTANITFTYLVLN